MTPKKEVSRQALGRGLESLLPERSPSAEVPLGRPLEISLDLIDRNPFQTRTRFDDAKLDELASSIRVSGVIQPVIVRGVRGGRYQLITGERRYLASQKAGKTTIPAVVRDASDEQTMEMTIVENLQRTDLNPMEQARAYERLSREFSLTQEQMAQRTGKDRASVSNFLRLLRLPAEVQMQVEEGVLSFGHSRALLALDSPEEVLTVAERIKALAMSVRQTESYIGTLLHPERGTATEKKRKPQVALDPNVRAAQEQLQRSLGLKVTVDDKNGKGRVIIEYSRLEDFDTLLSILTATGK